MSDTQEWWEILEHLNDHKAMPHRVLLWGRPGTGKTSWPHRHYANVESVSLNPESAPEELLGMWSLRGGETVFVDGPAVRAMKHGHVLVINEIDLASGAVEAALHAVLDDPTIARLTLPTGEVVTPKKGFRVFATMNGHPSELTEALLDRFEVVLRCDKPHPGIVESIGNVQVARCLTNFYVQAATKNRREWMPVISSRRCRAFADLAETVGQDIAALAVMGDNAVEFLNALVVARSEAQK